MPVPAISPRLHGALDYTTGTALLAAPSVLGLGGTPAGAVLRAAGASHIGYSLLTAYELGAVKVLPYRAHLAIDAVAALGLLAAPRLAGGARRRSPWPFRARRATRSQWLPHTAFGLWELAAVALSVPGAGAGADTPAPEAAMPPAGVGTDTTGAAGTGSGAAAGGTITTDPTVTVMPEGAEAALADRGAAARRGINGGGVGSGTGTGDSPQSGGLQS